MIGMGNGNKLAHSNPIKVFNTIGAVRSDVHVMAIPHMPLIVCPMESAELHRGLISNERANFIFIVLRFIGDEWKSIGAQEAHGLDFTIEDYFRGRSTAENIASQSITG
jgi:hypothetical protein